MSITRSLVAAIALAGAATMIAGAADAQTSNYSFTGNLANANQFLSFTFSASGSSTVELRSYSYAGGVNAQGTTIARGGFDPILSLYDATGTRIAFQDDGPTVPVDPATGKRYDVDFTQLLAAGSYTVLVSAYDNFCAPTLAGGCPGGGSFTDVSGVSPGNQRDSHFAFDILGVTAATGPGGATMAGAAPEPGTWAMMIVGFGLAGTALRRRKVAARVAFAA